VCVFSTSPTLYNNSKISSFVRTASYTFIYRSRISNSSPTIDNGEVCLRTTFDCTLLLFESSFSVLFLCVCMYIYFILLFYSSMIHPFPFAHAVHFFQQRQIRRKVIVVVMPVTVVVLVMHVPPPSRIITMVRMHPIIVTTIKKMIN
jgi:hypothetical protein